MDFFTVMLAVPVLVIGDNLFTFPSFLCVEPGQSAVRPAPVCVLIVLQVLTAFSEHSTVESYTVYICQQSYLLLFGIPLPTHSFFPGLKPSFSTNLSHCSLSFLSTEIFTTWIPRTVYCYSWAYLFSTFSFFGFYTF